MASNATSVVIIPLPSGWSEEYYFQYHVALLQMSLIAAIAFSVVLWDHFVLFLDEYRVLQRKDLRNNSTTWAFVILRYGAILATFPALFYTSIRSDSCQFALTISQIGGIFVTGGSGFIFAARAASLYAGDEVIKAVLGLVFIVMTAGQIVLTSQLRAKNGPPENVFTNCERESMQHWGVLSSLTSVLFDALVIGLTLLKTRSNSTEKSPRIPFDLYRDSLCYFVCVLLTNLMVLIVQALGDTTSNVFLKPMVIPFSIIITVACASRVFFDLLMFNQRQQTKNKIINISNSRDDRGWMSRNLGLGGGPGGDGHGQVTTLPSYSRISNKSLPTYSFGVTTMPNTVPEDEEDEFRHASGVPEISAAGIQPGSRPPHHQHMQGFQPHSELTSPQQPASPPRLSPYHNYPPDRKVPIDRVPDLAAGTPPVHRNVSVSSSVNSTSPLRVEQPPPPPAGPRPYSPSVRTKSPSSTTGHGWASSPPPLSPASPPEDGQEQYGRSVPYVQDVKGVRY